MARSSRNTLGIEQITQEIKNAINVEVQQGEQLMKETIETSGLGVEWQRSHNGRTMSSPGRVDTGRMRDSVEHDFQDNGDSAIGRFGWLNKWEEYFGYQEGGFFHNQANRQIRAMHAVSDAEDIVMENLERKIDGILRGH